MHPSEGHAAVRLNVCAETPESSAEAAITAGTNSIFYFPFDTAVCRKRCNSQTPNRSIPSMAGPGGWRGCRWAVS